MESQHCIYLELLIIFAANRALARPYGPGYSRVRGLHVSCQAAFPEENLFCGTERASELMLFMLSSIMDNTFMTDEILLVSVCDVAISSSCWVEGLAFEYSL